MQFSASIFYVLSLLAISVSSEREQEFATARIFLHKSTTSKFPLVVGSDFVVSYVVSNNGEAPATDLILSDRYDPSSFELIENVSVNGSVSFTVKELAPGALATFKVTVQPKIKGMYEATRAKIKYNPSTIVMEDVEPDVRNGFSTSLGKIQIISVAEQARLANKVNRDWLLLGTAVSVIIFLVVYLIQSFHSKEVVDVPVVEQPKSTKRKSN